MRLPYALLVGTLVATIATGYVTSARQGSLPATPILFVTQVPTPADFAGADTACWCYRRKRTITPVVPPEPRLVGSSEIAA